jgi:serine/threonine protein kinase
MATVYLARQTDLDRDVALKELKVLTESDQRLARRFLHEARPGALRATRYSQQLRTSPPRAQGIVGANRG